MKFGLHGIAGCALALGLLGCHAPSSDSASRPGPMELKIYDVPAGQADSLGTQLRFALADKAQVSMPAPNKVMVYAPQESQASIGSAIAEFSRSSSTQPKVLNQVQVHFWMVDAHAGDGADDPALHALSEPLAALRKSMGALHFSLVEAVSGATAGTYRSQILTGSGHSYKFGVDATGQALGVAITYNNVNPNAAQAIGFSDIDTHVVTGSGQYIVLAQSPAISPVQAGAGTTADASTMRLLVMRVDRMNPQP